MKKNILYVNVFFIIMTVLLLLAGGYAQSLDFTLGILFTEFGLILCGSLIYIKIRGLKIREVLRLKSAKPVVFVKVFFASICTIPVIGLLNSVAMWLINKFGVLKTVQIPDATDGLSYLLLLFTVAVSAGICEEVMFRGVILSSYEKYVGRRKAAIMAAFLFGIFHFNLGNLAGPFVLGMVYAYVTQVTGSIFPAIFGHFINNGIAVTASYVVTKFSPDIALPDPEIAAAAANINFATVIIPLLIASIIFGGIAFIILKSIKNNYPKSHSELYEEEIDERENYSSPQYSIWGKQPGKFGAETFVPIGVVMIAFCVINYLIFFSGI